MKEIELGGKLIITKKLRLSHDYEIKKKEAIQSIVDYIDKQVRSHNYKIKRKPDVWVDNCVPMGGFLLSDLEVGFVFDGYSTGRGRPSKGFIKERENNLNIIKQILVKKLSDIFPPMIVKTKGV